MFKKLLLAVLTLVIVLTFVVAMQPTHFRIVRTTTIRAPGTDLFAQVNDLHQWEAWSPWAKLDPTMKQTYDGPAAGTGAISAWSGNKEVGEGRMTIIDSHTNESVKV